MAMYTELNNTLADHYQIRIFQIKAYCCNQNCNGKSLSMLNTVKAGRFVSLFPPLAVVENKFPQVASHDPTFGYLLMYPRDQLQYYYMMMGKLDHYCKKMIQDGN